MGGGGEAGQAHLIQLLRNNQEEAENLVDARRINVDLQTDSDEEVEVDIDQLSDKVLWKLDRYTKTIVQKVRKKTSQKGPDAQGSKPASTPQPNQAGSAEPFNGKDDKPGHHSSSSSSSGGKLEAQG